MFKVRQVKVHIFGIPKCLQQWQNVDTDEVGITVIIITLKHNHVFLKKCSNWPDSDYESKHVVTFIIDNKLVVFWLNLLLEYLSENTSGWLQFKNPYFCSKFRK